MLNLATWHKDMPSLVYKDESQLNRSDRRSCKLPLFHQVCICCFRRPHGEYRTPIYFCFDDRRDVESIMQTRCSDKGK